ncbi:hypothetical protein TgHK011_002984 [Trichoderma gracile]|nr:hypothetical protein TgHK011_002984 [Trichoderma gracile]
MCRLSHWPYGRRRSYEPYSETPPPYYPSLRSSSPSPSPIATASRSGTAKVGRCDIHWEARSRQVPSGGSATPPTLWALPPALSASSHSHAACRTSHTIAYDVLALLAAGFTPPDPLDGIRQGTRAPTASRAHSPPKPPPAAAPRPSRHSQIQPRSAAGPRTSATTTPPGHRSGHARGTGWACHGLCTPRASSLTPSRLTPRLMPHAAMPAARPTSPCSPAASVQGLQRETHTTHSHTELSTTDK